MNKTNNSTATVENQHQRAIGHALDAANVAGVGASFLNDNVHPVVCAMVELFKLDEADKGSQITLIKELAKLARYLVEDAAGCMEAERDEMNEKLAALKGGVA